MMNLGMPIFHCDKFSIDDFMMNSELCTSDEREEILQILFNKGKVLLNN